VLSIVSANLSGWAGIGFGSYTSFLGLTRVYGFVIAATVDANELTGAESYINSKTGAY
jgi:hypothetical protein